MNAPLLSHEIILTLQNLEGIGSKTILSKIGSKLQSPITDIEDLFTLLQTIKGKKFESISKDELIEANRVANGKIQKAEEEQVGILSFYDENYPEILRQCTDESGKLDPPLILYYRGNIQILKDPGIAIIGTREPTRNGVIAGEYFASEFAKRGFNIVSGLAVGCDTTGHRGALKANGHTTAFLANGLDWDSIYPKENLELAKEIVGNGGLLLSEYPIGQNCGRYGLVARDRLQAGLSKATIVIQTGIRGGTMHAVNATMASGKPLFAVEFRAEADLKHEKVLGNIMLIDQGKALPLRSKEISEAIGIINGSRNNAVSSNPSLFD